MLRYAASMQMLVSCRENEGVFHALGGFSAFRVKWAGRYRLVFCGRREALAEEESSNEQS